MASSMTRNSFWILTVLAQGRRHGYDIMRDVEALSKGRAVMKTTTLYAALERLEKTGLIAGVWKRCFGSALEAGEFGTDR